MKLVLARHGNTFGPGDRVVWVGARSDLPLVEKGREQARAIGVALRRQGLAPNFIYAGPLKRTVETARLVAEEVGGDPAVAIVEELREIDYGRWEGLSNEDIRELDGNEDIDGWQRLSIWPENAGWQPDPETILMRWSALLRRMTEAAGPDATVLAVSSNGIFRVVAKVLGIAPEEAKMATGALALVDVTERGARVERWNIRPQD
ncbi:histidine phosphatase family protein [Consotaella salsifontis]|uniref:Probable phosphoglycerate mutase n=1 Tax=Consotaella salsifontis TaxID=1365950 RepID=A0A1T4T2V6_9HYPH|nr:histidine phosphatase family protein [Consotaella salsifontis]SKA34591.1 probable phosphoglycerate mutase [Consotaella salsifontis]